MKLRVWPGQRINLNGQPHLVVAVAPACFYVQDVMGGFYFETLHTGVECMGVTEYHGGSKPQWRIDRELNNTYFTWSESRKRDKV